MDAQYSHKHGRMKVSTHSAQGMQRSTPSKRSAKKSRASFGKVTVPRTPPKKGKASKSDVTFVYFFLLRLRGNIQLIWAQLRDNPDQDGFTHPLWELVQTDGSWARVEEGILRTGSRRAVPGPGASPAARNALDEYPRRYYVRDAPDISDSEEQRRCLQRLATVSAKACLSNILR